jgi:hypothetical protein
MSKDKSFKREKTQANKSSPPTEISSHIDFKKYPGNILISLIFWTIGFLTIPNLLGVPSNSPESSWIIGLNMAKALGLQFGKDIVFPFGPLGFMYQPYFCEFNTWLISSASCLFAHCLLIFSIILMIKKSSIRTIDCVLMGVTLMLALPQTQIEYKLLFSVLILLYLSIVNPFNPKTRLILYVFVSFIMAVASLIKFTAMLTTVGILIFMFVFCLYKKQIGYLCCMLFAYIVSILILLVAAGQKIINFPSYLLNSYEVANGYSSAMTVSGPGKQVFVGFCIVALFIFLLLNSILKNKPGILYFTLISAGFVFVSFKHGLVRQDSSHIYILFANALLVFCSIYITNKKQLTLITQSLILMLLFVLGAFIFEFSPRQIIPDIPGKLKMLGSAASLATDDTAGKAQKLEDVKRQIRIARPLKDATLQYIGSKSVDVMPYEISLPYAYNLNWSPRPVFQCYGVWTTKLDMLNSRYFESKNSPDILLYTIGTVDGRYQLFDAPATFRTILRNYKPVFIDGLYIVLRKADTHNLSPSKTISIVDAQLEKPIPVPKTNGYLFAKIYMDYNLLGKIAKLFYKPPNVSITLIANGMDYEYRFIFSTAQNGIFLSQKPIYSLEDIFDVWNGNLNNNLDAIAISAENPHFYDKHIKVEFFEVPK